MVKTDQPTAFRLVRGLKHFQTKNKTSTASWQTSRMEAWAELCEELCEELLAGKTMGN